MVGILSVICSSWRKNGLERRPCDPALFSVSQVFQEEMGVAKSYNLKPGGDRIPVTKQNRRGESAFVLQGT